MLYKKLFIKILKYKRIAKFFISGSISALVNIFSLFVLHGIFAVQVVLAASISFILAFLVNFSLQKFWTFSGGNKKDIRKQMLQHFMVGVFALGVNALGIYLLVEILLVWYILAQVGLSLFLAFLNYFLYKIIFIDKSENEDNFDIQSRKKINKILIATGIYPPDVGGPATYSQVLKNNLPQLGYQIKIVSYGEPLANDKAKDIYRISRHSNVLFRYFRYFKQVWQLAKWADIVYIQGPVSEGLPSYFACRLRRKRYILKVVGDFAWEQGRQRAGVKENLDEFQNKNYSPKVELWRWIEIFVASGAKLVITPSEYLKKIIQGWGIDGDKIKVIYNAVKEIKISKSKDELKSELRLPDKFVISVSRLVPWKGFDLLIDVMIEINKNGQDIPLYIAGDGPDYDSLQKKIDDLNFADKIILLGRLEQDRLWEYIKASNVFVLNTAYEGLSHLLIEAMALEIPIVTTDVGGNGELIENNKNGILLDYNNKKQLVTAIKNIFDDSEQANKFVRNAKVKSQKFSKKKMLLDLDNLLKKI